MTDTSDKVDVVAAIKEPLPTTVLQDGLTLEVKEISCFFGQFQQGMKVTKANGIQGEFSKKYTGVRFKMNVSKGDVVKGVNMVIYKNGKIQLSGGFVGKNDFLSEPEYIRKYIIDNYTRQQTFLYAPLVFNNLSGIFRVNGLINLTRAYREIPGEGHYEPELGVQVVYKTYKGFKYIISEDGNIQLSGVDKAEKLLTAYSNGIEMVNEMKSKGIIYALASPKDVDIKKKTKKETTTCPIPRRPKPYTLDGKCTKNTNVVRKNPQGQLCCYKKSKKTSSPPIRVILDKNKNLVIGGRQCMRYSKPALVALAKKLGIMGVMEKKTKTDICVLIVKKVGVNRVVGFENKKFSGSGANFRIGKRLARTMPKADLLKIAKNLKLPVAVKDTALTLVRKIEATRNIAITNADKQKQNAINQRRKAVENKKTKEVENTKAKKVEEFMRKRKLTLKDIRDNISKKLGRVTNTNVSRVTSAIQRAINNGKMKVNRYGYPLKAELDALKRKLIRNIKPAKPNKVQKKRKVSPPKKITMPLSTRIETL